MHDPMAVAHEIRRPWPQRDRGPIPPTKRWEILYSWGKWYRPSSYMTFWTLAGRRYYWPSLVTIWHVDPGGNDFGDVCKSTSHWRWHVHHWKIQIRPVGKLRRRLLTRCAWCGGRDRKNDPVNCSDSWDPPRTKIWQGEAGLYHSDCSGVKRAHAVCLCSDPAPEYSTWGECRNCGKFVTYGTTEEHRQVTAIYASIPTGQRPSPEQKNATHAGWEALRNAGNI